MGSLDVIVVNWNSGGALGRCLASLPGALGPPCVLERAVVVDNASTDGSHLSLPDTPFPVTTLCGGANIGFGAACNEGARGSAADYLLFLNPDVELGTGSIAAAVCFMDQGRNSRVGICGVKMFDSSGATTTSAARFPKPSTYLAEAFGLHRLAPRLIPPRLLQPWELSRSGPVEQVVGAFFLIRRSLFLELGGFDESYFLYYEEVDLSRRALAAGFTSYYLAEAGAQHEGGVSSRKIPARRLYYSLSSRLLYSRRYFSPLGHRLVWLTTLTLEPVTRLVHAFLPGSAYTARDVLEAYYLLTSKSKRQVSRHDY